jgi:hypothetical protein
LLREELGVVRNYYRFDHPVPFCLLVDGLGGGSGPFPRPY